MTRTCSRQPSAQPAVAACSRRRRGTTIARAANSGAKRRASELEAAAANATTAATAAPVLVRGRHSAAQNRATSRYQMVVDAVVGDLELRHRQQHHGQAEQGAEPARADLARAGVVSEQPARGRDKGAADREGDRGVPDRHQRGNLADQPRDQLQVPAIRLQQVPGMRERLGQVDARVLGVDAVPGRPAADTGPASPARRGRPRRPGRGGTPSAQGQRGGLARPAPGTGRRARRGRRGLRPAADAPRTRPVRARGDQARTRAGTYHQPALL